MHRQILEACLPFTAVIVVAFGVLHLTIRLSRARWNWKRLKGLHRDQAGGVQSLAFVLTLPVFIMVVSLVVQVSQLMLGMIGVHYAAYAGARAASVWIPSYVVPGPTSPQHFLETPNHVLGDLDFSYIKRQQVDDSRLVYHDSILDPLGSTFPDLGTQSVGLIGPKAGMQRTDESDDPGGPYRYGRVSPKYQKIWDASVLALAPFGTIYSYNQKTPDQRIIDAAQVFQQYYLNQSPGSDPEKLLNHIYRRLAWVEKNTLVFVEWRNAQDESASQRYHLIRQGPTYNPYDHDEGGLVTLLVGPDAVEPFEVNEVGWQDPITVHVYYRFPLMPGFGTFLRKIEHTWPFERRHQDSRLVEQVEWERVVNQDPDKNISGAYVIHASATMNSDGILPIYGEGIFDYGGEDDDY